MTNSENTGNSEFERRVLSELGELRQDVSRLSTDVEKFNDRFTNYQQATQWVVQLAFTLIASATLTVIITAVYRH